MRGTGSRRQHTRSRWHLHLFKSRAPRRQEPRRVATSRQRVATAQSGVGLCRPLRSPLWRTLRSPLWRTLRRPRRRAARPKEVGAVCARARRSRRRSPRRAGHAPLEPRGGVPRGGNRRVQGDQLVARPPCGTRKSSSTRMMSTRDLRDLLSTCPRICRFRREVERGSLYIHFVHMRNDRLTPRLGPCTICSTTLARAR